jgi:hypothetical protein
LALYVRKAAQRLINSSGRTARRLSGLTSSTPPSANLLGPAVFAAQPPGILWNPSQEDYQKKIQSTIDTITLKTFG